jgi:hypothetical protein
VEGEREGIAGRVPMLGIQGRGRTAATSSAEHLAQPVNARRGKSSSIGLCGDTGKSKMGLPEWTAYGQQGLSISLAICGSVLEPNTMGDAPCAACLQIDGMDVDEFIRRNADPIWLRDNGMWEHMT